MSANTAEASLSAGPPRETWLDTNFGSVYQNSLNYLSFKSRGIGVNHSLQRIESLIASQVESSTTSADAFYKPFLN